MLYGKVVVQSPHFDKAAIDNDAIDHQREASPTKPDRHHRARQNWRQLHVKAAVTLACNRRIGFAAKPESLDIEGHQRKGQQHDCQNCGTTLIILRADNGEEDFG